MRGEKKAKKAEKSAKRLSKKRKIFPPFLESNAMWLADRTGSLHNELPVFLTLSSGVLLLLGE